MSPPNRRASDEVVIRMDMKLDNALEALAEHKKWLLSHEQRINECDRQHVRIKTILAGASVGLTMLWTGLLYWFKEQK
ncbi:MAG: hypothetical protein IT393_07230 [Nitrospirae bacterium]|nr:hypothetical protein [Nitrospirota bacterium]